MDERGPEATNMQQGFLQQPCCTSCCVCWGVSLLCLMCVHVHRGDALSDRTSGAAAIEDLDTFCRAGGCWWAQQV